MNEVIAPEAPPKVNFTELNVRQEQGRPHFVRLNDSVVKRLERQLIDHPPTSGSERFGLLLGSITVGDPCTIAVEDFEPTRKLEERIGLWRPGAGSPHRIVGYYRSHRQADFVFDRADQGLFERCFPKGSRLALLVKPAGEEVGTAMFFLGDNGELALKRATVEFPFNLRELGAEDTPAVVSAPVSAPKPAVMATPKPAMSPVATAPVSTPKSVAAPKPASAPTQQPVSASVAKAPAPAVATPRSKGVMAKLAVAAVAVIALVIGLSELHVFKGRSPARTEASRGAVVVESKPAAEPPAAPAEPKQAVKEQPAPPKLQTAKTVGATTGAKPADASAIPATARPAALVAQTTPLNPPVVLQPMQAPTQSQLVAPAPPSPRVINELQQVIPPVATLSAPAPKPAEIGEPVTPPRAIRQLTPVLPDKVRKSMTGELVVRVKASVNAAGKVTGAEIVADGSLVPEALAANAVNAVKQWRFEPAQRGGEKVAGDIVLSFTFRK